MRINLARMDYPVGNPSPMSRQVHQTVTASDRHRFAGGWWGYVPPTPTRRTHMLFFSNRIGCLGSLAISLIATVIIVALFWR